MSEQHHFRIARIAEESEDFERELWTGLHAQLVLHRVAAGDGLGEEIHEHGDQVVTVVAGSADVTMEGHTTRAEEGDVVVIPRGIRHEVRNAGRKPLVLYSVYGPPQHAVYAAYSTRAEAEAAEESGEDLPPLPSN
jgi:mannose-6-phosphate isomerase-like protein (cupin superfamily)